MNPSGTSGTLRPSPVVLLLVDFINPLDFPGSDDLAAGALRAAQATAVLKRRAARRGIACIYANDNYGIWHSDFEDVRRHCLRQGPEARRIAHLLAPAPRDFTVLKPRHSAFYCTPLSLLLEQLQARRLIITGLAADNCVLATAMDAYVRNLALWVPQDCVAAEHRAHHEAALEQMARVFKAETRPALARPLPGGARPRAAGA